MTSKTFSPGVVIDSPWLNDVNDTVYDVLGDGVSIPATKAAARTNLGLGTVATQNSGSVAITGGAISGITDLAVADGGTGASTLTGYVKGTGTAPLTGSATVPVADITGTLPITKGGTGGATTAAALLALGASISNIVSSNGYTRLPGGIVVQWGTVVVLTDAAGLCSWNFPTPFSGVPVLFVQNGDGSTNYITAPYLTSFPTAVAGAAVVRTATTGVVVSSTNVRVNYIAFGPA